MYILKINTIMFTCSKKTQSVDKSYFILADDKQEKTNSIVNEDLSEHNELTSSWPDTDEQGSVS